MTMISALNDVAVSLAWMLFPDKGGGASSAGPALDLATPIARVVIQLAADIGFMVVSLSLICNMIELGCRTCISLLKMPGRTE